MGLELHAQSRSAVTILKPCHHATTIDLRASLHKRRKSSGSKSTHTLDSFSMDRDSTSLYEKSEGSAETSEEYSQDIISDLSSKSKDMAIVYDEEDNNSMADSQRLNLLDLPKETQQHILDYLVGNLGAISSKGTRNGTRNWNNAMRHPRAKEHTSLALVAPLWTRFIQERLYRHIRIKGTRESLHECTDWFLSHPHLQEYVRHIEFWVPIWEQKSLTPSPTTHTPTSTQSNPITAGLLGVVPPFETRESAFPFGQHYRLSSQSASMYQLFSTVELLFGSACILTIEGGNCKKPPKIRYFLIPDSDMLPELPKIRTLVMKGAWSLMREDRDFTTLSAALPHLADWQCMFASPKGKAYVMMYKTIRCMPRTLTHLHLCLEGFHSKKKLHSIKVNDLRVRHHLCHNLGQVIPQLEALTFSGRVCGTLFTSAMQACAANQLTKPRLKSVDIVLRNCCRDLTTIWGDGTGIYNWGFIQAFAAIVVAATKSLKDFPELNNLRIRFVDLDSPHGFMNPYFHIDNGTWFGIWSDTIVDNLQAARKGIFPCLIDLEGLRPGIRSNIHKGIRPKYIKVSDYSEIGGER